MVVAAGIRRRPTHGRSCPGARRLRSIRLRSHPARCLTLKFLFGKARIESVETGRRVGISCLWKPDSGLPTRDGPSSSTTLAPKGAGVAPLLAVLRKFRAAKHDCKDAKMPASDHFRPLFSVAASHQHGAMCQLVLPAPLRATASASLSGSQTDIQPLTTGKQLVLGPVNRIVCFFSHGFPSAVDFFQNTVRVGRPMIRLWVKVMVIKEAENVCHQGPELRKLPERTTLRVISPKKRPTRFRQARKRRLA